MLEHFYNIKITELQESNIYKLKKNLVTPAEWSKIMFENFDYPDDAINQLYIISENKKI